MLTNYNAAEASGDALDLAQLLYTGDGVAVAKQIKTDERDDDERDDDEK